MTIIDTAQFDPIEVGLDPVIALARDVRRTASSMDRRQAGYLVDMYYRLQKQRIALSNQVRSLTNEGQSAEVISHFFDQAHTLEKQMVGVLGTWAKARPEGEWCQGVKGIGPILSAGLSAHIDVGIASSVGKVWRFAGLDPTVTWGKGEKRPWNATLKVICWKIGHSFVLTSGYADSYYGAVYKNRKQFELDRDGRDEDGRVIFEASEAHREQAAETLRIRRIQDPPTKATYESGHLPLGRLDLRARRYTVKLFLSHWHEVAYFAMFHRKPELPYPIRYGQLTNGPEHTHVYPVPGFENVDFDKFWETKK